MTIAYENTAEDAYAWHHYHLTQTPEGHRSLRRKRFLVGLYNVLIVIAAANFRPLMRGELLQSTLFYLIVPLLVFLISYGFSVACFEDDLKRNIKHRIKKTKNQLFLGTKEVEPLPEGLRIAWGEGYAVYNWSSLKDFSQTETYLVLFYNDANFMMIPKRAFQNSAEQQTFVETVEQLRSEAVSVPVPASLSGQTSDSPWWRNRSAVDADDEKLPLRNRNS